MSNSIIGTWDVLVETPMGKQRPTMVYTQDGDSILVAEAEDGGVTEYSPATQAGDTVTFDMIVKKPTRMQFEVTITVSGNTYAGVARNRFLPGIKINGTRES